MRIEWNQKAFKDVRYGRTSDIISELEGHAERIADDASAMGEAVRGGFTGRHGTSQGRWRASVVTADYKAQRDNARNNTILRALDN
ncbi:hypothetical protein [Gordonia westfalica]|uniref:HK97 gp10 family phage protein n=1 Tax=Gordonia westfalica TaxID=158898 RepID=A0A1H2DQZ7_9ACTN|nr:hypothetical protein [Gordonia westfalica]SDT85204.1 hypothetical protein SAMN04488548_11714 [Gordonia westfalica]